MATQNEINSYAATLLWSSSDYSDCDDSDNPTPFDENYSVADLSGQARREIARVIDEFWQQVEAAGIDEFDGMDETTRDGDTCGRIMHDLCLTAYRHGAGFWDGDYPTHGDKLTEIAQSCGVDDTSGPYVGDDGLIYT